MLEEIVRAGGLKLTKAVLDEVRNGLLFKMVRAEKAQRAAARLGGERRMLKDGFVKMAIQPEYFHYWGQREGYECWEDQQFVHELLRDNPACRVRSRSTKIMSGYRAPAKPTRQLSTTTVVGTRFRKNYPA